jgi:hypothetical protein
MQVTLFTFILLFLNKDLKNLKLKNINNLIN